MVTQDPRSYGRAETKILWWITSSFHLPFAVELKYSRFTYLLYILRVRSHCAIFSNCDCDSSYRTNGLYRTQWKPQQPHPLLCSPWKTKANRMRNQKKRTVWMSLNSKAKTERQMQMQTNALRHHENDVQILKLWTFVKIHIVSFNFFPLNV